MGFFDDITGGSLLSLGGNLASSLFGGSGSAPSRVPIGRLVREAKKAGLHPLAALGHSPTVLPAYSTGDSTVSKIGQSLAQFGQDVDRAASAKMTPEQRAMFTEDLKTKQLQNEILGQELIQAKLNATGTPPAYSPGGPMNAGDLETKPDKAPVQGVLPRVQTTPSMIPLSSYAYEGNKAYLVPSEEVAEAMEGSFQGMPIDLQIGAEKLWARAAAFAGADRAFEFYQSIAPPRTRDMKINNSVWIYDPLIGGYEKIQLGSPRIKQVERVYGYIVPARFKNSYQPHRPDNKH